MFWVLKSSKFAKSNLSIPYLNLQQFRQAAQLTVPTTRILKINAFWTNNYKIKKSNKKEKRE